MPFTFAHPLYAAPLKRLAPGMFSLTGLVLGSMSPDFEYFIALEPYQRIGHTAAGLLLQALPLSLLLAILFHCIVKNALIAHLPSWQGWRGRARALAHAYPWRFGHWRDWLVFAVSVAIGFYSHVLLDGFTHATGIYVQKFPILQQPVLPELPLYKILQHGLSLIGLSAGLLIIFLLLKRMPANPSEAAGPSARNKLFYWGIVAATAVATVSGKLLITSSANVIGILVVASLSGCVLGVLIASLVVMVKNKYNH
ncbi:DUF4184 family protein [Paenibacillus sp. J5C_2022]|uniref:DUF4184 family protein n=1 Tax=Paenibacillus sp. J5C2022 TaxID=2977129 RepID=UPI0021CF46AD|nr:DUF4184 family protein [Paenibacillus sp. J5C2022]MCU6713201.1 DUF4184 family protein [Paenibacillus sp. J5C2022]